MGFREGERRGALLAGTALVLVGVGVFLVQLSGIEVGWPAWIVVPGLAIFVVALAVGGPTGVGLACLAGIVTSVGLVLAAQAATGAYASWAYAWALVAPGGVGAGMLLFGLLMRQWDVARGGLGALVAGVAIFLVGYLFFEGLLGLDGRPAGDLARVVVPAALIGLGLLVIVAAFVPWPRAATASSGWRSDPTWSSAASAGPSSATGSSPSAGPGPAAGAPDAAGASAGAASAAWPGGSATGAAQGEARAIPLDGLQSGEIAFGFGAGRLAIVGPAAAGHLVDGIFSGGVRREDRGPGSVRLTTPGEQFWNRIWTGTPPFDWRVGLSAEIPLRLAIETGAARTDADLSSLRVTDLRIKTGAAETDVVLPAAGGQTRVEVEAGAASVCLRVPAGVAARIRSSVALGTTDVDSSRFPRDPLGGWASPDYASAPNRVEIEVRGGVGAVQVR